MSEDQFIRDAIRRGGPQPTDPVSALRHVLALHEASDEDMAVDGTYNVYGKGVETGLTFGDLRAILVRLDVGDLRDAPWCWKHACDPGVCQRRHANDPPAE
jgi:hypothetical protein